MLQVPVNVFMCVSVFVSARARACVCVCCRDVCVFVYMCICVFVCECTHITDFCLPLQRNFFLSGNGCTTIIFITFQLSYELNPMGVLCAHMMPFFIINKIIFPTIALGTKHYYNDTTLNVKI